MNETNELGATILKYNDYQTPKCLYPDCRLLYDAHCKNCTACLDSDGPIAGCVPGCKTCDRGYFLSNRTESGRCEACHLTFPHCQTCERVYTTKGVESENVRCTGCDPLFVLHDGECISDGVFEFESPTYHVFQDENFVDVAVVRNLIRNTSFVKNVTVLVQSADVTAKSKSLANLGELAHFRDTNVFTEFSVPPQPVHLFSPIVGHYRDDDVGNYADFPASGSPLAQQTDRRALEAGTDQIIGQEGDLLDCQQSRRLTHLDPDNLGHPNADHISGMITHSANVIVDSVTGEPVTYAGGHSPDSHSTSNQLIQLESGTQNPFGSTARPRGTVLASNQRFTRETPGNEVADRNRQIDTVKIIRIPIYDDGIYNEEFLYPDPHLQSGHPGPLHPIHREGVVNSAVNPILQREGYLLSSTEVFVWDRLSADAKRSFCLVGACMQVQGAEYLVAQEIEMEIQSVMANADPSDTGLRLSTDASEEFYIGYQSQDEDKKEYLGDWTRGELKIDPLGPQPPAANVKRILGTHVLKTTPAFTGMFQLRIGKALSSAVRRGVPTLPDKSYVDSFAGTTAGWAWDIDDAPAFARFSGLLHFDQCGLRDMLDNVAGFVRPPKAIAVWATQNTTVRILFRNARDIKTAKTGVFTPLMYSFGKERVPQTVEFYEPNAPHTPLEELDASILKPACHEDNKRDMGGWFCIDIANFNPAIAAVDGVLLPFQIELTTPRPTEGLEARKVKLKWVVYSKNKDLNGNPLTKGRWFDIPYDCFKSVIDIRDSPFQGLKS
eukprot:g10592.t1